MEVAPISSSYLTVETDLVLALNHHLSSAFQDTAYLFTKGKLFFFFIFVSLSKKKVRIFITLGKGALMISIFEEEKEKLCYESKQTNFYRTRKSLPQPLAPNTLMIIFQNIHHLINIPNCFLPRNTVFSKLETMAISSTFQEMREGKHLHTFIFLTEVLNNNKWQHIISKTGGLLI